MTSALSRYLLNSRVYTSLVSLPLLIWLIARGPKWVFALLLTGVAAVALVEAWKLLLGPWSISLLMVVAGLAGTMVFAAWRGSDGGTVMTVALSLPVLAAWLLTREIGTAAIDCLLRALLLLLYVPFALSHLLLLWELPGGRALVGLVFLAAWGGDAAAYYAGMTWGRRKLAPVISPNKTVEGMVGSLCGAGMLAAGLALTGWVPGGGPGLVLLAVLANGAGQLGDLFESVLKRQAGVKDSGGLIPGHGGLLDRIDSVIFAVPVIYYGARWWLG
ncbi:MAG: phosphatidate cytidylyltransferase [Deltaproteobacteria bacterium]|nr:phosphatidate cytidylyltransferase [Candidatus Anaeroferrophillacea bacterium]